MGTQHESIHEILERLQDVREKVQGNVDDSVVQQLTEAILILEEMDRKGRIQQDYQDALKRVGDAIKWLPVIAKLIEILRDLDNFK